jgi:hypothetical protein
MSRFLTPLQAEEIDEFAGLWKLLAPLRYQSDLLGRVIEVPADFVTDFASVPRVLGIYDLEGGRCNMAAVVHDWAYSTQFVDRPTADALLHEAILACGYGNLTAGIFWLAVRLGGASHWSAPNVEQPPHVEEIMEGVAS